MEDKTFDGIIAALKEDIRGPGAEAILHAAFPDEKEDHHLKTHGEPVIHETHISVVFLLGNRVLKFKKPADFGFISQARLAERLANCENEIQLNRRLAPDVYLGILGVHETDGRYELRPELKGALEYCVVMRRLDDEDSLKHLLNEGRLTAEDMEPIAETLADFHRACARGPEVSALHAFEDNISENLAVLRVAGGVPPELPGAMEQRVERTSRARARRDARNEIVDGHGDLRPEHVYLHPDKIRVIDCVEFNPRIRAGDPFEDLAFLTMYLRTAERSDLADALTAAYVSRTADAAGLALLPLYELYRASVRAKIDHLMLRSGDNPRADYFRERFDMYIHFMQARLHGRTERGRKIIVIMGPPACGKSTHAKKLMREKPMPVISTDITRKQLLGLAAKTSAGKEAFAGAYAREFSARVYRGVLARARLVLAGGFDVILDGVFGENRLRRRVLRMARELGIDIEFHLLTADEDVIRERLARRREKPGVSDLDDMDTWKKIRDSFQEPDDEIAPYVREFAPSARS